MSGDADFVFRILGKGIPFDNFLSSFKFKIGETILLPNVPLRNQSRKRVVIPTMTITVRIRR